MFDRITHVAIALGIAALFACAVTPAYAGDADVCYQTSVRGPMQKTASPPAQSNMITSKTEFDCPRAGKHTLPELAQAGWSIVAVQPVMVDRAMKWIVVIQRK